jgi:lipopolysaccharide export system ATP-binding protein
MSEIVFRADSIARRFGDRTVLNSATLWVRSGCVTSVMGRNGSGKSTLFRIAAGLQRADQGVILFNGRVYARPRLHELARHGLFYLPERGLLQRNLTVGAHLDAVTRCYGGADRVDDTVAALDLGGLLDRMPDTLSGGERRRSELGLALVRKPLCLLADEPFMGMAPKDGELLAQGFRALARAGCAVAMSGHEVPLLLDHADEVVWLVAGTTHGLGSAADARRHWQFQREYLGAQWSGSETERC